VAENVSCSNVKVLLSNQKNKETNLKYHFVIKILKK